MSPTPINNTTRLDDLNDINLPHDSNQDQRETSSDHQSKTSPNYVRHQQETVLHDSEGGTAMDTTPNPIVTTRWLTSKSDQVRQTDCRAEI